jgi:8-oxo-dGTP pyrophosphatase MutT (NUDIX family)
MKPHLLSAGMVVFRQDTEPPRCLLLRLFANWDFPKGLVEAGEGPFAAARREVREETGLEQLAFPWGQEFRETQPYGRGKVARYYLARCDHPAVYLPVSPELGRPEHHEFRWASCAEAASLLPARLRPVLAWACRRVGALQGEPRF